MGFIKPDQIALRTLQAGFKKANMPLSVQLPLGFAAGVFIALGFLLAIRVSAALPPDWEGFRGFMGAAVFPLGLILCLVAGGELLTGNMMALPFACFAGKASCWQVAANWLVITISNFAGAIFVAYVFGHLGGMTEQGPYLAQTVALTHAKLEEPFVAAFISSIGCNWLVSLAVWMSNGSEDGAGLILAVWFPTMAFVAFGFQHVVANMFLIPAAIFAGQATWAQYITNFVPVFLGNAVGGSLFVAGIYRIAYRKSLSYNE
ncbi:formate/nitrite transporter family protein [Paenibacillus radicis (ex Xue et al. 2023)]|uniref:Formate/nitrite transporter family protein n=1 Tax=Paenibacillus radicis (ex Xue et al. 2023) TaxID=2972489 RepID=A0ABT1YUE6_9BACL|nr:formate/nitrite transporter family protein [Paenibacillus radicis (ex Xue et al. 2023)]MCR8636470.1 formate/nitrite transporter family protein [Paenibacillus radicis (ex Xue et al. 2023)]